MASPKQQKSQCGSVTIYFVLKNSYGTSFEYEDFQINNTRLFFLLYIVLDEYRGTENKASECFESLKRVILVNNYQIRIESFLKQNRMDY